jgi:hypothetical protein
MSELILEDVKQRISEWEKFGVEFKELKIKKIPKRFDQAVAKLNNLLTLLEPDVEVKKKWVNPDYSPYSGPFRVEAIYKKTPFIRLDFQVLRHYKNRYTIDVGFLFRNGVFPADDENFQNMFDRNSTLDQWASTRYDENHGSYTSFDFSLGDQKMDPKKAADLLKQYLKIGMNYLETSGKH